MKLKTQFILGSNFCTLFTYRVDSQDEGQMFELKGIQNDSVYSMSHGSFHGDCNENEIVSFLTSL